MNIWTFLGAPETAWISVAVNQTCTTEDFLLFGELIGKAIADLDRRVVLLASGGMTHRFFSFRELRQRESQKAPDNIYDLASYEADMQVLRRMQVGDHASVIHDMDDDRGDRRRQVPGAGRAVQRVRGVRRNGPGPRLVRAARRRMDGKRSGGVSRHRKPAGRGDPHGGSGSWRL